MNPRAVVLVEWASDQAALEALAVRRGRDLDAEGVSVVPMGGAKNIGGFLDRFGLQGLDVELAGLCDAAEEGDFRAVSSGPAWAPTSPEPIIEEQLQRFLRSHSGRKIQSAASLVDALDLTRVPRPLDRVLA